MHGFLFKTDWPAADRVSINAAESSFVFSFDNSALPPEEQRVWAGTALSKALTPYLPAFDPTENIRSTPSNTKNLIDCNVRFDPTSSYLEVNSSWQCNDKSASSP